MGLYDKGGHFDLVVFFLIYVKSGMRVKFLWPPGDYK